MQKQKKCPGRYGHQITEDVPGHYVCTIKGCGHAWWGSCGVLRVKRVEHHTLNLNTGEMSDTGRWEIVTEICNVPLFNEDARVRGVCDTCRSGWECEGNTFASHEEKARALKS